MRHTITTAVHLPGGDTATQVRISTYFHDRCESTLLQMNLTALSQSNCIIFTNSGWLR